MRGRDAHDALDLGHGVDAGVATALSPSRSLLAEVDAARQLAHDEHVDARQQLGPERRGVQQLAGCTVTGRRLA